MAIHLGIVQINVTDPAVAWKFYVDTLGLSGRWLAGRRAFELAIPAGPMVLVYPATRATPNGYPDGTGVVLVLYTDDLDSAVKQWRARDVEFIPIGWAEDESGIGRSPYGRFIAFRDPSGNVLELLEPAGSD